MGRKSEAGENGGRQEDGEAHSGVFIMLIEIIHENRLQACTTFVAYDVNLF